jgi:hypothetical protein
MHYGLDLSDLLVWQDDNLVFLKRFKKTVSLLFIIFERVVDERLLSFLILDLLETLLDVLGIETKFKVFLIESLKTKRIAFLFCKLSF